MAFWDIRRYIELSWLNSRGYWHLLHIGQGRDNGQHFTLPMTLAPENKLASIVLKETPAAGPDRGVREGKEAVLRAHREPNRPQGSGKRSLTREGAMWHVP